MNKDYDDAVARWKNDDRELTARRWRSDADGQTFETFTNGHFMLALAVDSSELEIHTKERWRGQALHLLRAAHESRRLPATRGDLISLAGEAPPACWTVCYECGGTARIDHWCERCDHQHECVCRECEGGYLVPSRTVAEIDGVLFDRRYVAEAIYFAARACGRPPISAAVSEAPDGGDAPGWLTVRAGPRLAMVLAMRRFYTAPEDPVVVSRTLEMP